MPYPVAVVENWDLAEALWDHAFANDLRLTVKEVRRAVSGGGARSREGATDASRGCPGGAADDSTRSSLRSQRTHPPASGRS